MLQVLLVWLLSNAVVVDGLSSEITENPKYKKGKDAIKGEYVILLNEASFDTFSAIEAEGESYLSNGEEDGVLVHVMDGGLEGFSVDLNDNITDAREEELLKQILADPDVISVEENQWFDSLADGDDCPGSWGLDRTDQTTDELDGVYHYDFNGSNVDVYILDTGIRDTHSQFEGRVTCGSSFVPFEGPCEDGTGHGTHVAGTVGSKDYGVAKGVNLIAVKVLRNLDGAGSTTWICSGLNWVMRQAGLSGRKSIINMSLGSARFSDCMDRLITRALNQRGILTVVAAGNSNVPACLFSPASTPAAVTVGATQVQDWRASFSNYGACVDIFAPGHRIAAPWYTSDTSIASISGTSMAAPHIAGVAAIYWEEDPTLAASEMVKRLAETSHKGAVGNAQSVNNHVGITVASFTTTPQPANDSCIERYGGGGNMRNLLFPVATLTFAVISGLVIG